MSAGVARSWLRQRAKSATLSLGGKLFMTLVAAGIVTSLVIASMRKDVRNPESA